MSLDCVCLKGPLKGMHSHLLELERQFRVGVICAGVIELEHYSVLTHDKQKPGLPIQATGAYAGASS